MDYFFYLYCYNQLLHFRLRIYSYQSYLRLIKLYHKLTSKTIFSLKIAFFSASKKNNQ